MEQDNEIIKNVLNGNTEAYSLLVDKYKIPIFNLAFRMTGNYHEAKDISQEIFIKSFKLLNRYDSNKKFFTWLYTLALNLIKNNLKRKKKILFEPLENLDHDNFLSGDLIESSFICNETKENLILYLQKLPIKLKEALVLRFLNDFSFKDISKILNISLSSAKMRVYRGLEKLSIIIKTIENS